MGTVRLLHIGHGWGLEHGCVSGEQQRNGEEFVIGLACCRVIRFGFRRACAGVQTSEYSSGCRPVLFPVVYKSHYFQTEALQTCYACEVWSKVK